MQYNVQLNSSHSDILERNTQQKKKVLIAKDFEV